MMLLGHDGPWREWRAAVGSGRMHHGWILAGQRGLGKAQFALAAAAEVVGGGLDPRAHPDVLTLAPLPDGDDEERKRAEGKPYKTKRNISVDQIRAMQRRLTTRPTLGAWRCVIVDAADDMEKGAFNALLKSLEEPPAGTVFLLVAHRPGRLPATIRSRCRVLRFTDAGDEAIGQVLATEAPELGATERLAAISAARGSPGAALDFAVRGLGEAHALMVRIAAEGDPDFALRGTLLGTLGQRPDREQQVAAIELARTVLVRTVADADRSRAARIVEAHAALARLLVQAPTANFDPATLVLEIGGLLASAAADREFA